MIINHNMAALNTYNRLSANNSQTSKSLEKLSSGLRINRAGDDAAGLAISEKMRGQIRGLDQASRNAQDAVSLLQTAEGNLNETHSILQRMKELATQAANDTNVGVDRGEIQKEINQLSSEINRIGNTTEFNKQQLLNGGTQVTTNSTVSGVRLTGGQATAATNATAGGVTGTDAVAAKWNSGNIALGTGLADGDTFSFGGVTITVDIAAADPTHVANAITVNGVTNGAATLNFATGDATLTNATAVRDALLSAFNQIKGVAGSAIADVNFGTSGTSGLSAADTLAHGATNNAWTFAESGAQSSFANVGAAAQQGATGGATGVTGIAATSTMAFTNAAQEGSYIVMADKKIAFYDSTSGNFKDATEAKSVLGADFVVDVNGVANGTDMATAVFNTVGATGIGGWTLADGGAGTITLTANATGVFQGHNKGQAVNITGNVAAKGSYTFTDKPAEGSSIEIGGQKIAFYDSSKGNYADDTAAKAGIGADFAVDVKGLTTEQVADKLVGLQDQLNAAYTGSAKDINLAKSVNANGTVDLKITAQTAGFGGNTITTSKSALTTSGFKANLQIGANTSQSMTLEFSDMRADALKITNETTGNVTASNGKVASYVAVANVTNGSDNENVEYSLDVSDHKKASAAISVLEDAIEAVSAERSKMGAYQNRLEHTINNLGTSSENLTAAESRIRDVDMAKEMMNFQKNNILSQAAQAMLAQANQQPQGVLQLLR